MKKLLAIAAFVALGTGSVFAADMAPRYAKAAPMIDPGVNWSGFYVGGTVGGAFHSSTSGDEDESYQYANTTNSAGAFVGGLTAGYNYQFGNGLVGIESDINWSSFKATSHNLSYDDYFDSSWSWFSTVRGRAGLAVGNALIYATAGVAFVQTRHNLYYTGSSYYCGYYQTCNSETVTGFTAGVGAEYMFNHNWSMKAEYLYIGLPNKNYIDPTSGYNVSFKDDAHIGRLGINYHFN
jgi:outer membrane immunogenic protein